MPTKLFAQETKVHRSLQGIEETSLQRLSRNTNKRNPMSTDGGVIERKRRPTSNNTQQPNQSPKEQVQKSNTSHAEEACRLRAGRRAVRVPRDTLLCASRDARFCAPGARSSARRERAVLRAGKRAVLRAGRRAGCTSRDVPGRAVCAPGARSVRARGRPVRPFSSRLSLSELRGRSGRGREAARPAWPPEARGVPRTPEGTRQTSAKAGAEGSSAGLCGSLSEAKESKEKHTEKTRRLRS